MAKLWSTAPQPKAADEQPPREPAYVPRSPPESNLDPETLDVVQRFEQAYARFEPAPGESARTAASGDDDFFSDLPDLFDAPAPARSASAEPVRVVSMPRRETEVPSSAHARATAPGSEVEVDLDEAMAILRASEQRGGTRAAGVQQRSPGAASNDDVAAVARRQAQRAENAMREGLGDASPAPSSASPAWAARAHGARKIAISAAVIAAALAIGAAGGHLVGSGKTDKSPRVSIETTEHGGTQLRLERNLPQR